MCFIAAKYPPHLYTQSNRLCKEIDDDAFIPLNVCIQNDEPRLLNAGCIGQTIIRFTGIRFNAKVEVGLPGESSFLTSYTDRHEPAAKWYPRRAHSLNVAASNGLAAIFTRESGTSSTVGAPIGTHGSKSIKWKARSAGAHGESTAGDERCA